MPEVPAIAGLEVVGPIHPISHLTRRVFRSLQCVENRLTRLARVTIRPRLSGNRNIRRFRRTLRGESQN